MVRYVSGWGGISPYAALTHRTHLCQTAYETFFIGGAYREALIEGWLQGTVPATAKAVEAEVKSQEQPDGPWWNAVNGTKVRGVDTLGACSPEQAHRTALSSFTRLATEGRAAHTIHPFFRPAQYYGNILVPSMHWAGWYGAMR